MKKLFHCLLATIILAHLSLLAMEPPSRKIDETSPLIQSAGNNNRQERIIKFANKTISKGLTLNSIPKDPELGVLLSMGMRLEDQEENFWSKRKAPYYRNLSLLIDYLVGFKPARKSLKKADWTNDRITELEKCLSSLRKESVDEITLNFLEIIYNDESANKQEAIGAYYYLIDYILSKHQIYS